MSEHMNMSDEQRLELERLREECLRLHHGEAEAMAVVLSQEGQIERLQQENARLRWALQVYGQHFDSCLAPYQSPSTCTCGLGDALQGKENHK